MSQIETYIYIPAGASVTEALCAYLDREAGWWWFLVTNTAGNYTICSFGSLLPYLTGKTPHIVHEPEGCPICNGVDTVFWGNTTEQVAEALADPKARARRIGDLPMAPLPTITVEEYDSEHAPISLWKQRIRANPYGVTDGTRLIAIEYEQTQNMGLGFGEAAVPAF